MNVRNENVKILWIDVDDTLLDFNACARQALQKSLKERNLRWDPALFDAFMKINPQLWRQIEQSQLDMEGLRRVRWKLIFEAAGYEISDPDLLDDEFREHLHSAHVPVKDALTAVCKLAEKYPLYIVTNGPYEEQTTRLSKAGLLPYFKGVLASSELEASKPDPAFFAAAVQEVQKEYPDAACSDILVIGDSWSADIQGALNAGLPSLWFGKTEQDLPAGLSSVAAARDWQEVLDQLL